MASGTSPVLVLEDDAILCNSTPYILPQLASLRRVDLINLETFRQRKLLARKPTKIIPDFGALFTLYRDRGGAACYMIWPKGAARLLEYTESFSPLADAAINLVPGLSRQQIVPALAVQEMHLLKEDGLLEKGIASAGSRPGTKSFIQWLRGRKIRLYTSFHILTVTLFHLRTAIHREVPFADD